MNNLPFSDNFQTNAATGQLSFQNYIFSIYLMASLILLVSSFSLNAQQPALPSPQSIIIFYQFEDNQQTKLIESLQAQLTKDRLNIELKTVDINKLTKKELKRNFDGTSICSISIGENTTKKILSLRSKIKTFALNVSRNQLNKLNQIYKRLNIEVSGIYQEQSLSRQILLARALQPELNFIYQTLFK